MCHSKIKVLVHSNYSRLVTGFGKNMRNILLALYEDPDIEVIEAANGVRNDADLATPWQSYGTYPNDANILHEIENDPMKKRAAQYGFYCIDSIIEKVKPDIYLGIEDIWAFDKFDEKPWWNSTKKILWTTLDSLPILDQGFKMHGLCDKMLVWASFAEKAMTESGYKDVETVHGAIDYSHFKPLENRQQLRKNFNLDEDFVIGFVFKNQLRKSVPNLLEGFKLFKQENPTIKAKLLLHTDWGEKTMNNWDVVRYIEEKQIDKSDILASYVCHSCEKYIVSPYRGEEQTCPFCSSQKSLNTKTSIKGVSEQQLNEIYNLMDVYCHPFTSGGQEIPIQEAKSAGLITLVTEYSCGTDSCYEHQGGIPLEWNEYREPSTQFIKASTCPKSISAELKRVFYMPKEDKQKLIENGINYVKKAFSVENTVSRLKDIFKSIELKKIDSKPSDESKKIPTLEDLLSDVPTEQRIAVLMPQSAGDVLMVNSLIENLHELYPDKKIFFFTDPRFFDMINDNPYIYRLLPYQKNLDNLHVLEGRYDHKGFFEIAFLPHIGTQKIFNYHHNAKDKNQFQIR